MADKKQKPGDEPEPATEPETADPADGAEDASEDASEDDPAGDVDDDTAEAAEATPAPADAEPASSDADGDSDGDADGDSDGDSDQRPTGPFPTRVGWVVAAFLLFWPLAIPALVLSMRTAEANGTGNVRRAEKSSVRTLDLALGAVTLGVLVAHAPDFCQLMAGRLVPQWLPAERSGAPVAIADFLYGVSQMGCD